MTSLAKLGKEPTPKSIQWAGFKDKASWDKKMEEVYWAYVMNIDDDDPNLTRKSWLATVAKAVNLPVRQLQRMMWVNWNAIDVVESKWWHEDVQMAEQLDPDSLEKPK